MLPETEHVPWSFCYRQVGNLPWDRNSRWPGFENCFATIEKVIVRATDSLIALIKEKILVCRKCKRILSHLRWQLLDLHTSSIMSCKFFASTVHKTPTFFACTSWRHIYTLLWAKNYGNRGINGWETADLQFSWHTFGINARLTGGAAVKTLFRLWNMRDRR